MCAKIILTPTSKILRWVSLSLLFGGSLSIVVAAITLVKAAEAQGIPVIQAASANAPMFVQLGKMSLIAGLGLLLAESLDYASHRRLGKLLLLRYTASLLCAAATMIFSLGLVPPLEKLRPAIQTNQMAYAKFQHLHKASQVVVGATILLSFISLVLPAFSAGSPELDLAEKKG